MNLFDYLLPFILALGLLVLVHELGHYLVARWCGVKVLRFSVGFGKPLLVRRAGADQTEWVLAAVPLGGYVRMLDEAEGSVAPADRARAFNRQSVYRRFAIVAAGPAANFLLAILLYWGLFVVGADELRPRVTLSATPAIAAAAGVADGDLVTAVDGEAVRSWQELRWVLLRNALDRREVELQVQTLDERTAYRHLDLSSVRIEDGKEDLVARIGLAPWRPQIAAIVGRLVEEGAGARGGLREGDRILGIDGENIADWIELVTFVRDAGGRTLRFEVERAAGAGGHEILVLEITPDEVSESGRQVGRIGVGVAEPAPGGLSMFAPVRYGIGEGLTKAVRQTWDTSVLSLQMLGRMFTGEVSWKNLSGPVTIADYAGQSAQLGLGHYLKFLALISISLGVLNLLPIPVLDGGHLLYYVIEIIKGGPVPDRVIEVGQRVGFILLAMLMAFAFFNDINRLISG